MTRRKALKISSAPQALWSGGRSSLVALAFQLALPGYDLLLALCIWRSLYLGSGSLS